MAAQIQATETPDSNSRTAELSFASPEPYKRYFWLDKGIEYLPEVLDTGQADLSRFDNGLGCLLFNHDYDNVIGAVERVWLDGQVLRAQVRFDEDELSDRIYQKVKSGTLKGVSVGYRVEEYEHVDDGEAYGNLTEGPAMVATKWMPLEISIVSVPADASVGVGRSMDDPVVLKEDGQMPKLKDLENINVEERQSESTVTAPAPKEPPAVNVEAERKAAMAAERERITGIMNLCRTYGVDAAPYITEGVSLEEAQARVAAEEKARNDAATNIQVQRDEADKYRASAEDALLMRAGIPVAKPAPGAAELRSLGIRDLMVDAMVRAGETKAHRWGVDELMARALTPTSALPGIMSNVANKSLLQGFQEAPATFERFTAKGSNRDFKPTYRYRLGEAGDLLPVKENGEFERDTVAEEGVQTSIATVGREFGFTRQMLINDDLSALTTLPRKYAMAARRGINKLVYQTLVSANYTAAYKTDGAALSLLESIKAARKTMRKVKGVREESGSLNITPQFMIVPSEMEYEALQLMNSTAAVEADRNSGVINPFHGSMDVIVDAALDDLNEKAKKANFYLVAAPTMYPAIEVTYLNGVETPFIEQVKADALGVLHRVVFDFGVTLLDIRGLHQVTGKAL